MSDKRWVVELALRQYEGLTTDERIRCMRGVAEILHGEPEAQHAENTAWMLQRAQVEQLTLFNLFQ